MHLFQCQQILVSNLPAIPVRRLGHWQRAATLVSSVTGFLSCCQLALWLYNHTGLPCILCMLWFCLQVITGATKTEQLKDNLAAVEVWLLPHKCACWVLCMCPAAARLLTSQSFGTRYCCSEKAALVVCNLHLSHSTMLSCSWSPNSLLS